MLVKKFFGRLVQQNLCFVLGAEPFAVPGLAVGGKS